MLDMLEVQLSKIPIRRPEKNVPTRFPDLVQAGKTIEHFSRSRGFPIDQIFQRQMRAFCRKPSKDGIGMAGNLEICHKRSRNIQRKRTEPQGKVPTTDRNKTVS